MDMTLGTNSFCSNLTNSAPGSKPQVLDQAAPEHEKYDILQPRHEIDAIIDNKLYLGE
jgi:hypothetical protein